MGYTFFFRLFLIRLLFVRVFVTFNSTSTLYVWCVNVLCRFFSSNFQFIYISLSFIVSSSCFASVFGLFFICPIRLAVYVDSCFRNNIWIRDLQSLSHQIHIIISAIIFVGARVHIFHHVTNATCKHNTACAVNILCEIVSMRSILRIPF